MQLDTGPPRDPPECRPDCRLTSSPRGGGRRACFKAIPHAAGLVAESRLIRLAGRRPKIRWETPSSLGRRLPIGRRSPLGRCSNLRRRLGDGGPAAVERTDDEVAEAKAAEALTRRG